MTAGTENADLGDFGSGHDFIARYCSGAAIPAGTWIERDDSPILVMPTPDPERSAELRRRIAASFCVDQVYAHPMTDDETSDVICDAKALLARVEVLTTSKLPESWGYVHRNAWGAFVGALRFFVRTMSRD